MAVENVRIAGKKFSFSEEIENIKKSSRRIGGIAVFLGTVRDFSEGRKVEKLVFEDYEEMAVEKMKELREEALERFDIIDASIVHRTGEVMAGENIVLVTVGAEHRKDAFLACEWLMDGLKKIVPIWKKEITADRGV